MSVNAQPGPLRGVSKAVALAWVAGAYALALLGGAQVLLALAAWPPVAAMAAACLTATGLVFAGSLALRNSSLFDPYWSLIPIAVVLAWLPLAEGPVWRTGLIAALVIAWGIRLTWNWARGWHGFGHEDWRYERIRERTGSGYWLVSALGIHLFPAVQVFLGLLPVYGAFASTRELGWLDGVAVAITAFGIVWEAVADRQLHRFRSDPANRGRTLTSGLWRTARHPNYLGEILFWVGLALFASAAGRTEWWYYAGAVTMIVMFRFISLPLIDARMLERRDDYARRMATVNALLPWPARQHERQSSVG